MSYDLAFWTGTRPESDSEALAQFEKLYQRHVQSKRPEAPASELLAFVAAATRRYPDLTELPDERRDEGVWSDGPLQNNIAGPLLYLGIAWSRADEVRTFLIDLASKTNLVAFDPQTAKLASTSAGTGVMAEVVVFAQVIREPGFIYFLRGSDVWRTPVPPRPGVPRQAIVVEGKFAPEAGYRYFVDLRGNISRIRTG